MLLSLSLALPCGAQSRKPAPPKGPRATGLLQLMPNGQAHLIPIVILVDGKYYDAGSYKATPVPMALESGTVYEAFRTGNSEGLFTVTQVRQLKDNWIADGNWRVAGSEPAKKAATDSPTPRMDEDEGPPKLRHSSAPTPAPEPAPATPAPAPASETASQQPAPAPEPEPAPEDPNRPVLHRGTSKPSTKSAPSPEKAEPAPVEKAAEKATPAAKPTTVQFIPAISDAKGPEPHPYTYDMKPDEEQRFRNKMLALAANEVRARDKQLAGETTQPAAPARPASKTRPPKPPQPNFEDVQLKVFDLSNSNEPTLVLIATARMPQTATGSSDRQYFVALVARNDIYNELHKGFANVTDSQHLDVTSRLDLLDAVDVDGDNRGELLFRQTSDTGQGYIIYRVIGDQLYPLYQSSSGH